MRLLLHIGTEKTGSTAIQLALQERQEKLAETGVALPRFLDSSNHRALASLFIDDALDDDYLHAHKLVEPNERRRHRQALLEQLAGEVEAQSDCQTMVISSEHFHSRLLQPKEVQAFANAVKPLYESVTIVCYLRRQDAMALSFYTQKLRAGFVPPTILPIANIRRLKPKLPPFFDYDALLNRWAIAFGEAAVNPVVYDRNNLVGGDVVSDFFARLDVEHQPKRSEQVNSALSSAAQMALLAFNRFTGSDLDSRMAAKPQRDALSAFLQREANGLGVTPSDTEAGEFLQAFAESNRQVALRWFDRDTLFESTSSIADKAVQADWEGGAELLARFIAEQDQET